MNVLVLLLGIFGGLLLLVGGVFLLYYLGFYKMDDVKICIGIVSLFITGGSLAFVFFGWISNWGLDLYAGIGIIIGVMISLGILAYSLCSPKGKLFILNKRIDKVNQNIEILENTKLTSKQKNMLNSLQKAKNKIIEQSSDILLSHSINIIKKIEMSNNKFDIQLEMDELEALQSLKN